MSASVAVGVFDGVHLGHRSILAKALDRARDRQTPCVVLSFDPHPDVVLAKSFQAVLPLTPLAEKRERLEHMGIDRLDVLPFTRELARLEPREFVERHLVERYGLHTLVVGEDFALGKGRAGNVPRLRDIGQELGFGVEAVPLVQVDGGPVTSTRIRALLAEGRVAGAARLLGRRYGLTGTVVTGEAVGRELGYPTANLRLHEEKLLPADGVYAAWARIADSTTAFPAATSIGVRPTFGGQVRTLEVHLLDWSGDLVGALLHVELADWLRSQERFDGPEALIEAMGRDVAETRRRLGHEAAANGL